MSSRRRVFLIDGSSQMYRAYHAIRGLTGPDGSFEIQGVPAGKMEFVVWHEKVGYVERSLKIDVVPDQTVEVRVKVPAAKLAAM